MKSVSIKETAERIRNAGSVALLCHTNPDEDTVGILVIVNRRAGAGDLVKSCSDISRVIGAYDADRIADPAG